MDNRIFQSLDRYYTILSLMGYINVLETYKIMSLIALDDILNGEFASFVTENDSRIIQLAITCLGESCLIPSVQTNKILYDNPFL